MGLRRVFSVAPQLNPLTKGCEGGEPTSLTVVIPAFNEESNVEPCLRSILESTDPCAHWNVLLVDDGSNDATHARALRVADAFPSRCRVIDAGPRPADERWVGKNWACSRAMEQVSSEWVLFVDADVRVLPEAIARALNQALVDGADLLSLAPRLECGCLAEWMVQPIMASLLGLGFPIEAANDPESAVAFAAGPFMLFRRSAYTAIGGHRDLAGEVVEDLALAKKIKSSGYRLRYLLGLDAVLLRMYEDLPELWEGWTKNWFLGLDRNIERALGASFVVVLMFAAPWLLCPTAVLLLAIAPELATTWCLLLLLSLLGVMQQLLLRWWNRDRFCLPLDYWWLMGVGGLIIGLIGPVSVWRTLTGRGWTWKGRQLA